MEIGKADLAKTTRELSCSPMLQTCFDIMICRVYRLMRNVKSKCTTNGSLKKKNSENPSELGNIVYEHDIVSKRGRKDTFLVLNFIMEKQIKVFFF